MDADRNATSSSTTSTTLDSTCCFHCIVPEFVWEKTFEALKYDAVALINCTRASSSWNEMLRAKKTDFMIFLVLPVLSKHLSFGDIEQCRLVSRNWRTAVDGLNERAPELYPHLTEGRIFQVYEYDFNRRYPWNVLPLPFHGWTEWRSKDVWTYEKEYSPTMNDFKIQSMNPFPTRVVHLYAQRSALRLNADFSYMEYRHPEVSLSLEPCVKLEKDFLEMLQIYGSHIWHLVLTAFSLSDPVGKGHFFRKVVRMLHLVPNIRSLTLNVHNSICSLYEVEIGRAPPLPSLTVISIPYFGNSNTTIFLLANYGHQLLELECNNFPLQKTFELPKLTTLKLWGPGCYKYPYPVGSVVAPRLERLTISWAQRTTSLLLWTLLDSIGHFASSLVELRTYGNGVNMSQCPAKVFADDKAEVKPPVRHFPRLKIFRIDVAFWLSQDLIWLLSKFPVLEELHLEASKPSMYDWITDYGHSKMETLVRDRIDLLGWDHLWMALPKLQKIYVSTSKDFERVIKRPC